MAKHHKVTFTRGREVIEHCITYLKNVSEGLEAVLADNPPERLRLLATSVEAEERQVLGALERYLEDAGRVVDTYAQFSVELPDVPAPDAPLTNLALIQWLQRCHQPLRSTLAELGENADSAQMGEVFRALAAQVEAHERRLSKEYQRFEDL